MKTRNRHHKIFASGTILGFFMFAITATGQSSGGNFQLTQTIIAGGGNQSGGGNFTSIGTAGQPAAGTLNQQGALSQTGGFWPGAGALTQSDIVFTDVTGTYGGTVTLTATLKANGVPLSGQSVIFSLNGASLGAATTDVAGVATLNNVSVSGINAGIYPSTLSAQFAGDLTFAPSNVAGQLTVQPATPQLQVIGGAFTYDGQAHAAVATLTGINNEVLAPVVVLYNGSNLLPVNAGSYSVKASFAGNQNYAPVSNNLQSVLINKADQTINFAALADRNLGEADFAVVATASSNLAISFTASGTCAVNGNMVHLTGAGACTVTASQSGDGNYSAAASVPQTFNVSPAALSIRFSASNYTVNEDGVDAVLTVVREGDLSNSATVEYATSDQAGDDPCSVSSGFASQRCDYEITMRTLTFAAGESTKTISIPIIDDAYVEAPETFTVTLSNPTGAGLGSISVATVTILDNDSISNVPNPIGDTGFFVRMNYLDFLNREPDPAGFAFWVNNIDSCGVDADCRAVKRVDTSAAFFLSIEYQQTGYLVYRTYLSAFGKPPQAPVTLDWKQFLSDTQAIGEGVVVNQSGWQQLLEQNKQQFMNRFVQRAQFVAAFPTSLAPADFVDHLFANAGVAPSNSERQAAIGEFGTALDTSDLPARGRTLRRVAENASLSEKEMNRAFVLMQYFGYLRRNPNAAPDTDFSGYNFWLQKLDLFNGNYVNAEMVKSFLVSREYLQRFGQQ